MVRRGIRGIEHLGSPQEGRGLVVLRLCRFHVSLSKAEDHPRCEWPPFTGGQAQDLPAMRTGMQSHQLC